MISYSQANLVLDITTGRKLHAKEKTTSTTTNEAKEITIF